MPLTDITNPTYGGEIILDSPTLTLAYRPHRNFGILVGYIIFFMGVYLFAAEYITAGRSKGEVLIFRRDHSAPTRKLSSLDEETGVPDRIYQRDKTPPAGARPEKKQTTDYKSGSVFHWKGVCYDITIKGKGRRILDNVDGWVKPGTLTALMVRYLPGYWA